MQEQFDNFNNQEQQINDYQFNNVEAQEINVVQPKPEKNNGGKGLKIFCIALAGVILLSCFSFGGYYLGKNNVFKPSHSNTQIDANLSKKPTDSNILSTSEIYSKVSQSVVGILVYNANGYIFEATGVVYSNDGYIVTNDHIYASIPAAQFKVYTQDGRILDANYVAGDTRSDLAVLKIKDTAALTPGDFGDSDEVMCGENVCAVGYANGYSSSSAITNGIVSAPRVRASISSSYSSNYIQTDITINTRNSGCAIANEYGQIIGLGVVSTKDNTEYEGAGFAIPTRTVKYIVESLIVNGNVKDRAKLGISYNFYNSVMADLSVLASEGLLVKEVSQDSDLYGKLQEGDIITRVNDIAISDDSIILDLLEECKPGETVLLTIINTSGETQTLSAKLLSDEGSSSYVNDTTSVTPEEPSKDFNFPEGY